MSKAQREAYEKRNQFIIELSKEGGKHLDISNEVAKKYKVRISSSRVQQIVAEGSHD